MEAGLPIDFHSEDSHDYGKVAKMIGDGRYEKEACIHAALGLFGLIPVMFIFRSYRNNMEISRENPFLLLICFTVLCSYIRTAQHIVYLLFTGALISINKCTVMAHTYYVAEVLPQQITLIVLINSFMETRGRNNDLRTLFKRAGIAICLAITLNLIQFNIGTLSPNFPLCAPYNINFELNDIYHHLGFCILFADAGLSAYLCFGITNDGQNSHEVRRAVSFSLFIYSSCCLAVVFPLSVYTHVHEFSFGWLAVFVNAFEFFHSLSTGFLASVFILRVPYLRTSIVDSITNIRDRILLIIRQ